MKYNGILFIPLVSLPSYRREYLPTKSLLHISEISFMLLGDAFSVFESTIKVH